MTTFQDRIRAALAKPLPSQASSELPPEFEQVLAELVKALEEARPSLQTAIETEGRTRSLVTFPRYRRDEKTTMFSARWNGSVVRVAMGEEQDFETVRSPDELREYLLRIVDTFEFRSTIDEYEELCKEDVGAFLQIERYDILGVDTVIVTVSVEEQRLMATATPGRTLTLRVRARQDRAFKLGAYKPSQPYRWLSSGGYELRITEHRQEGEDIVVTGTVMEDGAVE